MSNEAKSPICIGCHIWNYPLKILDQNSQYNSAYLQCLSKAIKDKTDGKLGEEITVHMWIRENKF